MVQRLIADVRKVHRKIELLVQVVHDVLVGDLLHDPGHVVEAHVAIQVFFLSQGRLRHGIEDAVGIIVDDIEILGHAKCVALVHLIAVELSHRPVFVNRHLIKRDPCLQSGLMRHDVDELQLAMGLVFQIREKIGQGLVEVDQAVVIELHDGQGGSENLGARCEVIEISRLHLVATTVGEGTKAGVINDTTILHSQHLTSRIGIFGDARLGH